MRKLALVVLLAASTPWASAQRFAGSPHFASAAHPGATAGVNITMRTHPGFPQFARTGQYSNFLYPFLPYGDGYYNDSESGNRSGSQPQIIVLQVPQAPGERNRTSEAEDQRPPAQALMIELQGDHYVNVSGSTTKSASEENEIRNERDQPRRDKSVIAINTSAVSAPALQTSTPKPPAHPVLIFHDGHTEEIRDYTIADGSIYARGDLYTDGYWNKKIQLASLDLTATLKTNQSRNIHFALPTSPNEVIVGP